MFLNDTSSMMRLRSQKTLDENFEREFARAGRIFGRHGNPEIEFRGERTVSRTGNGQ